MHVLGIRRGLVERHPFLVGAVMKAFEASKRVALDRLTDTSATKVTLPFVEESLRRARQLMGEDFFSYGLAPNRPVFDYFLRHHHAQGLSARLLTPEELFHPASLESHKV
jgi:4,5-dihydroxyphthalate decarboxylase